MSTVQSSAYPAQAATQDDPGVSLSGRAVSLFVWLLTPKGVAGDEWRVASGEWRWLADY